MSSPPLSFSIEDLGPPRRPNPMGNRAQTNYVNEDERLLLDPHLRGDYNPCEQPPEQASFEIAGARREIFFEPERVRAAVVTCGGLSPGLNAVIRGIVLQLWYFYGCRQILGIRYGYGGLGEDGETPLVLNPSLVTDIHNDGGTILGSSRGSPTVTEIVDGLQRLGIDILFTIGGDGTMRGAEAIWDELRRRGLEIAVVGVPKTIDNDVPFVRRSFGFETAVERARESIDAAEVEAKGVPYGIGLVKLMGRHAGFITATAALASGNANFVLIPEVPFSLEGEDGLFALVEGRLRERRHAVIVIAEGAGQELCTPLQGATDASGNRKLADVGVVLRERLNAHFAPGPLDVTLKYIDPSYLIRSSAPNATDQIFCDRMARNAVHAAMAGKTGMLIGYWHGQMTHLPMHALRGHQRRVTPEGDLWFSVLENTGQPGRIGQAG